MYHSNKRHREKLNELIRTYQEGMTISQLGELCGLKESSVIGFYLQELHARGVWPPRKDYRTQPDRIEILNEKRKELCKHLASLWEPGMTESELAKKAGYSKPGLQHYVDDLKEYGVTFAKKPCGWLAARDKFMNRQNEVTENDVGKIGEAMP